MKITNTFVRIADDSDAAMGLVPKLNEGKPSLARMHYDLLSEHPYEYDIDTLNYEVWCRRNGVPDPERDLHREAFFSKGHPCMRASPLTRTHGFGAHYNGAGKIAIYPVDSIAYYKLLNDIENKVEMAMRTKRPTSAAKPAHPHPGRGQNRLHSHA